MSDTPNAGIRPPDVEWLDVEMQELTLAATLNYRALMGGGGIVDVQERLQAELRRRAVNPGGCLAYVVELAEFGAPPPHESPMLHTALAKARAILSLMPPNS